MVVPERVMVEKSAGRNKKSGGGGLLFLLLLIPFGIRMEEVLFPPLAYQQNHVCEKQQNSDSDKQEVRS
jgi:hypothetical protein